MANPSISIPDELLEDFDDVIWELEKAGELPRNTSRSTIVQQLMREYVEEHEHLLDDPGEYGDSEGNLNPAMPAD